MKHTLTKKKKKYHRPRATKTPTVNYYSLPDMTRKQDQLPTENDSLSALNDSSPDMTRPQDQWPEKEVLQKKALNSISLTFGSLSLEEVKFAFNKADPGLDKSTEALSNSINKDNKSEYQELSTSLIRDGSSPSGLSGSSFAKTGCVKNLSSGNAGMGRCRGRKQPKRLAAATGTVSTVIGKEYVKASARRDSTAEAATSYTALDALMDSSTYSYEESNNYIHNVNIGQDTGFLSEHAGNFHASSEPLLPSCPRSNVSSFPREVLDSLFNFATSSEHEPSTMNWRNVLKKMQSLGPEVNVCPSDVAEPQQDIYAEGDGYHEFRKTAEEHWDSRKSYRRKAAKAKSEGQWEYAAYLSDQGKKHTQLAREADEKASQDIFKARNKGFENVITIDLHGQHVEQAIKLLKLHLLFGTHVPCKHFFNLKGNASVFL
ncbi:PfkB-like carbohydrate kinase family protein [Hibiscus syriacus]|uniref:PfkB-like carbohydrate kinase family protein n=1 Tax=Hibiscus syriacus TaxID=106335 RepID=A0A6A3CZ25_HIBSY|nr:PfkB-like carbohydrate kinase family protein [Hibiscus syriacus]